MRKLLFLSRVTFICNLCFILTFLFRYHAYLPPGAFTSTVIMLGTVVAVICNFLLHFILLILVILGNASWRSIPGWLLVINFCILLFQLISLLQ